MQKHRCQFLCNNASDEAKKIQAYLEDRATVDRLAVAGTIRRRCETHRDIDLVACAKDHEGLAVAFEGYPEVEEVLETGAPPLSVMLNSGMRANLRIVEEEGYPLLFIT